MEKREYEHEQIAVEEFYGIEQERYLDQIITTTVEIESMLLRVEGTSLEKKLIHALNKRYPDPKGKSRGRISRSKEELLEEVVAYMHLEPLKQLVKFIEGQIDEELSSRYEEQKQPKKSKEEMVKADFRKQITNLCVKIDEAGKTDETLRRLNAMYNGEFRGQKVESLEDLIKNHLPMLPTDALVRIVLELTTKLKEQNNWDGSAPTLLGRG